MIYSNVRIVFALAVCFCWIIASCTSPAELKWNREQGYKWAELSPGFFGSTGFRHLDPSSANIEFKNFVSEESISENRHYLNGSGVAAGDVDGDGWIDLYFAQLEGPNRLYKNMGGLRFKNITGEAGVAHEGYNSTGVVFADVDGDADLDLLITSLSEKNELYINDGQGHFKLEEDSGLGPSKGSNTMALADIDADGDLDLYISNYKLKTVRDMYSAEELSLDNTVKKVGDSLKVIPPFDQYYGIIQTESRSYRNEYGATDELYINTGNGTFKKANDRRRFLDQEGNERGLARDWGLTAKFQDINGDMHPDLYVCNDFWTPDRIWINQGDGTFKSIEQNAIPNLSFSSMGVDFSDINRDGSVDLFVTEMLSAVHQRRMRQLTEYLEAIDGRPQYNRNSLYLNRGDNTFAETSYFSNLEASEWSWATHFLDVDLDGYEDLVITTGHAYDYQDMDTQLEMDRQAAQNIKATGEALQYPSLKLENKIFHNNKDLTFSDKSREWGFAEKDISLGMAVADLDNDGDPDLAINRLNQIAAVYENTTTAPRIAVRLNGKTPNTQGIGAKIELRGGPVSQTKEIVAGGSYVSGSQPQVLFAASEGNADYMLTVIWPDGKKSRIDSVRANRIYVIEEAAAGESDLPGPAESEAPPLFEDVPGRINHTHHEDPYNDFNVQALLPVKLSQQGPGVSWIDYDRDEDDDLFVASGKGGRLAVFENTGDGRFKPVQIEPLDYKAPGDQTTILGWSEGDRTRIIVGSANFEQGDPRAPSAVHYSLNRDQKGSVESIPGILSATGPLAASDYDRDGDVDLFVGGRFNPGKYPQNASSRLFKNENGNFRLDRVNSRKLSETGLVTSAVFSDYDLDGDPDLLLGREWDSILLLENENGNFRDVSSKVGLGSYHGWWNGIATGDFNNDGLPDIVATNIGLNSPYQLESGSPLKLYYQDFNMDGRLDIVDAYFDPAGQTYVPRRKLYEFDSVPVVLRHVKSHEEFAGSSVGEIFGRDFSIVPSKEINTLEHMLFINKGGSFAPEPLPEEAQFSAAFYAGVADFDNDGNEDLFLSQNLFPFPPNVPRLDSGRGLLLKGDGKGNLQAVPGQKSGVKMYGEQRGASLSDFNSDGRVDLAVSRNEARTKLYLNKNRNQGLRIRLIGPDKNRDAIGSSIRLVYEDGSKGPRREIQAGSGYWSQNSTIQVMGYSGNPAAIEIIWFDGKKDTAEASAGEREYTIRY